MTHLKLQSGPDFGYNKDVLKGIALLLFIFIASPTEGGCATFVVHTPERLKNSEHLISSSLKRANEELSSLFQRPLNEPVDVLVVDEDEFYELTGNLLIVAFAEPERRRIVLNLSRMKSPETLQSTLKHELCHLYVHRASGGRLPRWLNEGFCQYVSTGLSELLVSHTYEDLLKASERGGLLPIHSLDRFPEDDSLMVLAYEESRSFVEFLVKRKGIRTVLKLLEMLKKGIPPDRGVKGLYGLSLDELQHQWEASLRRPSLFVRFLGEHIYEMLFVLGAFLTVAGFCRFIYRRRRGFEDEEEEDVV